MNKVRFFPLRSIISEPRYGDNLPNHLLLFANILMLQKEITFSHFDVGVYSRIRLLF